MKRLIFATLALAAFICASAEETPTEERAPLVVHEWGTFTVLQDDNGNPVDGVNINEESLPGFVHTLEDDLTPDSHELAALIGLGRFEQQRARLTRSKGIVRNYHAARMRMETPIIYMYPPKDQPVRPVNVDVKFRGGWITEWFPNAKVNAPGYVRNRQSQLTPGTTGSIIWPEVSFTPDGAVPNTDSPVWLAPRATTAPVVATQKGEADHYLFYRGVANLQAPLRIIRKDNLLFLQHNRASTCQISDFTGMRVWLVNVLQDGGLQYEEISIDPSAPDGILGSQSAEFGCKTRSRMRDLRKDMQQALTAHGLYEDEAIAMLNTWAASYFNTPGLRVFFTLPQDWTDRVLPLNVSGYENIEYVRTMIGRIELVSAELRTLLQKIEAAPRSSRAWFNNWYEKNHPESAEMVKELAAGSKRLEDFDLEPPADYQAYMQLGRFRDALILHSMAHPEFVEGASGLKQFASNYGLRKW